MTILAKRTSGCIKSRFQQAASGFVVISSAFFPGFAHAETRVWVNTSLNADIGTNPYLRSGPNTSAASGIVSVSPGIKFVDSVKTISLSGNFRHREFVKRYGSSDNFAANVSLSQKLSPRLGYNANMGYSSSIVDANNLVTFGSNPTDGGVSPPPPSDIALNGLQQRRQAISGGLGLNYTADSRNSVQTQAGFSMARYPNGSIAREYNDVNGSIGYSRVLNSRTSVGLNVSYSRADYLRTSLGDASTISPHVTFSTKFGTSWNLSTSLGVSHSKITSLTRNFTQDSASGKLTLCHTSSLADFCLHASRSVRPTSFGSSVRPQTSVGITYNLRLDSLSTIAASANVLHSGQITQGNVITGGTSIYGAATVTYSRRISPTLNGVLIAGYADSYKDPLPRKANSSLSLGISYAFGG